MLVKARGNIQQDGVAVGCMTVGSGYQQSNKSASKLLDALSTG
jgi:hypothetical protein